MIISETNIPIQKLSHPILKDKNVTLSVKREDLIHPEISGNKWRKLKYNLLDLNDLDCSVLLTFGGAYSNHIRATAAAGKYYKIKTIGIIRGDELKVDNPTLIAAQKDGMELFFVSRAEYKLKEKGTTVQQLVSENSQIMILPEGGANEKGVLGCSEIVENIEGFDVCAVACGTGGTLSGMINASSSIKKFIGFPVLKGAEFLETEIKRWLISDTTTSWNLNHNFHFGGYAKYSDELLTFIRWFYQTFEIKLDPVYTGKMMFGIWELIKDGTFDNQNVLAIHTGGLQGIEGFEKRYKLKLF